MCFCKWSICMVTKDKSFYSECSNIPYDELDLQSMFPRQIQRVKSCLEYSTHYITASLVHVFMRLSTGLPVTSLWICKKEACRHDVISHNYFDTKKSDFHCTFISFNGQIGQWACKSQPQVECQEWQMWFKISSPAFITQVLSPWMSFYSQILPFPAVWLDKKD